MNGFEKNHELREIQTRIWHCVDKGIMSFRDAKQITTLLQNRKDLTLLS